ncbi:MAG: hypothetical protein GXY50_11115 [Syntrophomonadaceae bacterium]|nr:hypothetical protein [Syntrophomonadaceae bacterium]
MRYISAFIALILLLASPASAMAQQSSDSGQVYLVVVDKLSITDIGPATMPELAELARSGAVGLASSRTIGSLNTVNGSITIGAGNLARTFSSDIAAYNVEETVPGHSQSAGEIFHFLTNNPPDPDGVVLLSLPATIAGMKNENTNAIPGAMGDALRFHGFNICVLGNGDTGNTVDTRSRSAVTIAMDAQGRVPLGNVGSATASPSSSYLGLETNYDFLSEEVARYKSETDVFVIELSDLARLEKAKTAIPEVINSERKRLLLNIDDYIGSLKSQLGPKDFMLIISPSPSRSQVEAKAMFLPVIISGPDYEGSLTSGSTRRDYMVANTDLAPTILNFMGIDDFGVKNGIGQPIVAKAISPGTDILAQAQAISDQASLTNRLRSPLVKGYVVFVIIVIILSIIALTLINKIKALVLPLVLAMGVVPLVLLFLGRLSLPFDWAYGVAAVFATLVLTLLLDRIFKSRYHLAFVFTAFLTLLALNLDIVTGTTLIQSSILGYDPIAGARYYGIGNEYMGVLIGCGILVAVAAYQYFSSKWFLGLIGLFLAWQAFLISSPFLGANTDGVLTAPAAFLVTLIMIGDFRINSRTVLAMGSIVLMAVLGLTFFDLSRPPEMQSHVGRAAGRILTSGWQEGLTIIIRKASMNLKLIRYTIWSRVFLSILAALMILFKYPAGAMARIRLNYKRYYQGFFAILIGAVVGLIVNDSGIVAAATTSIYAIAPLLILILFQNDEPQDEVGERE